MSGPREVWMPVPNYENRYEVSNLGRVRNSETLKILRSGVNRGYAHVALYHAPGESKTQYIHVLVLRAFCGPPPFPGAEGCHNNGDRQNNALTNLRWGSRQENVDDRGRHGRTRFGTGQRCAKLNEDQVRAMRQSYRSGKGTHTLAREYGLSTHTVWCAVTGKTWKHVEGAINNVG
ncbi:NUMOD4 motif-containing HNH endonuclease [Sphingobium sp. PNB]|uniref:NUMOD4 domain-containing protein n=1 Tax=Sphingobium sp. PNB TaxID=863934 RepID=UPI001CA3F91F|nr:NUMOD4 domain-containing protein [Sphingobium sp. PNB]MCB4860769.1 NUMOD4 motif-containing HNH endonuclease [Sphingobium sp. PNB]